MEKIKEIEKDMTPKLIRDLGMKFPSEKSNYKIRYGLYECQYCGGEFETMVQNVKCGGTKSCGCLGKLQKIKHGMANSIFYKTWNNMLQRCTNSNHKDYKDYGARGITVCEEWQDVTNFVAWCELTNPNIEGYSLDRIDNDKGYSPENCTWSDKTTQAINQRIMKNNKSGYVGVIWNKRDKRDKRDKKWRANIGVNNKLVNIGYFSTKEEAVQARDNYIIENNLPHKLSIQY